MWWYFAGSLLWATGVYDWAPKTALWLITGAVGSFALFLMGFVIALRTRYPKQFRK
jgi:hypothetical protein